MLQSSYAIISFKVTISINLPVNFMTFDINNGLATYIYDYTDNLDADALTTLCMRSRLSLPCEYSHCKHLSIV